MENDKKNNDFKNDREGNEMYHFMVKQYNIASLKIVICVVVCIGLEIKITFDKQSNIYVDGEEYKGTSGLRHLIMMKKPTGDNPKDLDSFAKLMEKTNVKYIGTYSIIYKWKEILSLFPSENHSEYVAGHFLPNDINSLEDSLGVLLGEYQAGNKTTTRNEIVPIIDELCKGKAISRKEYKNINYLSKC